jgi:hypothetical protein
LQVDFGSSAAPHKSIVDVTAAEIPARHAMMMGVANWSP